jgi:hypothetical protein
VIKELLEAQVIQMLCFAESALRLLADIQVITNLQKESEESEESDLSKRPI